MQLQLTTHSLDISFTCGEDDHYDHSNLLKQLAELIDELENHTGVDLVITSTTASDDEEDKWND
jgi:hypothetical protein